AAEPLPDLGGPSRSELILPLHGIIWSVDEQGVLWRQAGTTPPRPLLHDVRSLRWRSWGDAVEVGVRLRVSTPYLHDLAGGLPQADSGADETLHWLVVTRGGGALSW